MKILQFLPFALFVLINNSLTTSAQAITKENIDQLTKLQNPEIMLTNQLNKHHWPITPPYFDCLGKEEGYYADYYRWCKVFHYCKPDGTIMSFVCPEDYIFDDFKKICGPPDKVECPPYLLNLDQLM